MATPMFIDAKTHEFYELTRDISIDKMPLTLINLTLITSGISFKEKIMFNLCMVMNKGNSVRAKNVLFSTIKKYHKRTHIPKKQTVKKQKMIALREVQR